jgi:hypothetical protein
LKKEMLTSNIISRIIKHAIVLIGSFFSTCNEKTPSVALTKPASIVVPKIDLGDTSRYVKIQIDMASAGTPDLLFTDLLYDKSKGFLLMKDDGIITDYTIVYKILNGGIVNGKRYPGFTFTDGAGKSISYKYSFAVNANDEHSTSPGATTWSQMIEMVSKGHAIMNHTLYHGGTDKLKAIKDAEKNLWAHTHYRMTEIVPPGSDEGFVATGLQIGYKMFSSEFAEPIPDGNNDPGNQNMTWGSYIPMTSQNFKKVLVSRTNLGDQWNEMELRNAKTFVDYILNNPKKDEKLIGTAFSHGPFSDHKESVDVFFKFLMYIKHHPANKDSVWVTSSKEMMDFEKTKEKVIISSKIYDSTKKRFTIVLDMNAVDQNVIWRNLSFKIKDGKINNVTVLGANDVTFNSKTGLINIYKLDRSRVADPFKDILPPQIISVSAKGNLIKVVYDKPVVQSGQEGYEISGNVINQIQGSGKNWQFIMKNNVTTKQNFSYRMQRGNTFQQNCPGLKVCSYINHPIAF